MSTNNSAVRDWSFAEDILEAMADKFENRNGRGCECLLLI